MQTYIIKTIILTAIFVAVIYFFIFRRIKKNKSKDFDSVKDYHETYLEKKGLFDYESRINHTNSVLSSRMTIDNGYTNQKRNNYITRYNSNEDYREL